MRPGVDLADQPRSAHHLLVHPHLGLLPLHGLGEEIEETGVTGQPAGGVVDPAQWVEVDPLHAGEIGVWGRFAVPEKGWLDRIVGEHVFDDTTDRRRQF